MDDTAQGCGAISETLVPLTQNIIDFKVGLFTTRSRLGRAVQSVGTYALPGDTTALRSPIRSTLAQGLTPGGGGGRGGIGRRIGGSADRVRCPAGFEFGGRFTNSGLTNCGQQLFESLDGAIANASRRGTGATLRAAAGDLADAPDGQARTIRSLAARGEVVLSRAVSIPNVGAANNAQRESKIAAAAAEVVNDINVSTRLVRRDGTTLRPVVSIEMLRAAKDNPDMDGAAFVVGVKGGSNLGKEELPTLLGTNLRSVVWAFPGGGTIRIDKAGDVPVGERRRINNAFNRVAAQADGFDYDAALREVAQLSEALTLTSRFPGISKPNERITVQTAKGQQRIVSRWVYHIFLSPSAELRGNRPSWTIVETTTKTAEHSHPIGKQMPVSVLDSPIQLTSQKAWLASIDYKASAYAASADLASYALQVKRVSAVWDADLPPEGGFRCPPGTRYGGRITDRFGRNCGWNVGRRLANRLEELGRGIGEGLDERRDERVAARLRGAERQVERQERRIARAQDRIAEIRGVGPDGNPLPNAPDARERRLARRTEARDRNREIARRRRDRLASRLSSFADRMDGGQGRPSRREQIGQDAPRRRERVGQDVRRGRDRVADRLDNFADRMDGGEGRRSRRQRVGENRRRDRVADRLDNFADRMDGGEGRRSRRDIERIRAEQVANARRNRRNAPDPEAGDTPQADAPEANLPDRPSRQNGRRRVVQRDRRNRENPNARRREVESQAADGPIGPRGDNDDLLFDLNNWDRNIGPRDLSDEDLAQRIDALAGEERAARQDPDGFDPLREERRRYLARLRAERNRRNRNANRARNRQGQDAANGDVRDPEAVNARVDAPEDAPEAVKAEREAVGAVEELIGDGNVDRVDRAEAVLSHPRARAIADENNQRFERIENNQALLRDELDMFQAMDRQFVHNGGNVQVDPEVRAVHDAHLRRLEQRIEELNNPVPEGPEQFLDDEIGGSMPDARSLRNVRNRFRHRGVPDEAWWRVPEIDAATRDELDRRFGRYYDERDQINARGRLVNGLLAAERGERIAPQVIGRPAENPPDPTPPAPAPPKPPRSINTLQAQQIRNAVEARKAAYDATFQRIKDDKAEVQRAVNEVERSIARRGNADRLDNESAFDFHNRSQMRAMMNEHRQRLVERIAELEKKERAAEARRLQEEAERRADPFHGDAAKALAKRVAEQRAKRAKILGAYLDKRYGKSERPWLDKDKNIAADKMVGLIAAARGGDADAKNRLANWARAVYQHDEVDGADGAKFRTVVATASPAGDVLTVQGRIEALNPATGNWELVGKFTRYVNPTERSIKNSYFAMGKDAGVRGVFAEKMKNKGFQTVFNPHAFMWGKGAGFKKVEVNAGLTDGPYVWGRVGFRPNRAANYQGLASAFDRELSEFRAGRPSIIEHADDAEIVDALIRRSRAVNHDPKTAPGHLDYILALSNRNRTKTAQQAREKKVGNWFKQNARFDSGTIDLTDDNVVPADPRGLGSKVLLDPVHRGRTPRVVHPRRGRIDEQVDGLHQGREIVNPAIASQTAANKHVKDGGSMAEVPNRFWAEAIKANSVSKSDFDRNGAGGARFVQIPKNGGAIGDTRIYVALDDDGRMLGQGFVLKGARTQDNVNEVIGYNLAADHGIMPEGAGWDGTDLATGGGMRGQRIDFVVVPHAFNIAEDGDVTVVKNGGYNYVPSALQGTPDRGFPEMYGHFLHNYLMRVSDRHGGNGMMLTVNGKAYVIPIDQGWGGKGTAGDPVDYMRSFSMHTSLNRDIKDYAAGLPPEQRRQFYERIVGTYDGMLERAERNIAGGKDAFVARMLVGVSAQSRADALIHAERTYGVYEGQVERMRRSRDASLAALGYAV